MRTICATSALLLLACAPPDPSRLPRILSASPGGTGVAPDRVLVEVTFGEPVSSDGVLDGRLFALCREEDRPAVVDGVESGGLAPGAPVVAGKVTLADEGRRATLAPAAPLQPLAGYAIVVGTLRSASGRPVLDPDGRRRAFVASFETGPVPDRQPPAARWILPPHGPAPSNVGELRLDFGEPVTGSLSLPGGGVPPRPIAPAPGQLGLELAAPLPPGPLALSVSGVLDLAGNPAEPPPPLAIAPCADVSPPAIEAGTEAVTAGELWLEATATAGEMARLGAEVALADGAACGALPDPPGTVERRGEILPCPGQDPCAPGLARCPLGVRISGLCPGRAVGLRLWAEDLAGNRSSPGPWIAARTAPPTPRPVLAEALADAAAPEGGGEYVEVANVGTGDADLAGWWLAKRTASGSWARCQLGPSGPLPPGGHALVVGGAWDGRYTLPAGVVLHRCGTSALLGGLANDRPPELALEDPTGLVVSTFGIAEPALRCTGRSVERIHPLGPDATANFACAPSIPGTPGACNGATPAEECPRRPW